jgi:hypothetical protein
MATTALQTHYGWSIYAAGMSAEREELVRLVEEMPDEQVPRALAEIRRLRRLAHVRTWPPAWFASAPGDGDAAAANSDERLSDGSGQH